MNDSTVTPLSIDAILVPQGAEYQAVCRGLRGAAGSTPLAIPIPMGVRPVQQFLQTWQPTFDTAHPRVLVMGLCGSLVPRLSVGDGVVYQHCLAMAEPSRILSCDRPLTTDILSRLSVTPVTGLTSDRFLHSAQEKLSLGQTQNAAVVDMEGTAILEALQPLGMAVAMVRVVSDDCHHEMPDLSMVANEEGQLKAGQLAIALLRQPLAGVRLIRGSLRGLQTLERLSCHLFSVTPQERGQS